MRYWVFFRMGHGTYLTLGLSFLNFIVLQYRLLIEKLPVLRNAFPHLMTFGIIFVLLYVPVAIVVGWVDYRKGTMKTDSILRTEASPFTMDITRAIMIDSQAFIAILDEDKERARALFNEAISIRKQWVDRAV